MIKLITGILLVAAISCGSCEDPKIHQEVSLELRETLSEIEQDLGVRTTIPIINRSLKNIWGDKHPLGVCFHKNKRIIIDVDRINSIGYSLKLTLLHEIGHCHPSLNIRDYIPKSDEYGCTTNIMRQGGKYKTSGCENNYDKYIQQLKSRDLPPDKDLLKNN